MNVNARWEAVRKEIRLLEKTRAGPTAVRAKVIELLRRAIPAEAACCTEVDPMTLLSTGAVTEDRVERMHHQLFENEYLRDDFNKYSVLARASDPTASLSGATEGRLERSDRYRSILQPFGFGDEMRTALVLDGVCWGYLTLFRHRNQPLFHEAERAFLSSLVPGLARAIRRNRQELRDEGAEPCRMEPGLLVLSERLALLAADAAGSRWLAQLQQSEQIDSHTMPRPIRAVCSRARSETAASSLPQVCLRMPDGPFVTIRASRLRESSGSLQLAVCFEAAKPSAMSAIMAEANGLSHREKQIYDLVLSGCSTKDIATSLHITAYTVQDHMKSIFRKTGVTSRRELVRKLVVPLS